MGERALVMLRAIVATLGTLPFAMLAGIALARLAPGAEDVRVTLGLLATIPLWIVAMCLAFLDSRVWRAALALGCGCGVLWLIVAR